MFSSTWVPRNGLAGTPRHIQLITTAQSQRGHAQIALPSIELGGDGLWEKHRTQNKSWGGIERFSEKVRF